MKPGCHLLVAIATLVTVASARSAERPNVLLIMADDLGYSDLGCYGGEIATPNLDRLAENGLRFTRFYNTARCWPTRAVLLTGYYAQQVRRDAVPGIPSGGRGVRQPWARLLPVYLKPLGYRSYHSGKWHIDGLPIAGGFDRSYYLKDQGRFFNPTRHSEDDRPLPPVAKDSGYYATTAIGEHAIKCLKEHEAEHAEKPFFHYLAFTAPHFPLHALPEDIAKYRDIYRQGWEKIRRQRWTRMKESGLLGGRLSAVERDLGPPYHFPEHLEILGEREVNRPVAWESLSDEQREFQAIKMAIHAAMVDRMDVVIGGVLDQIRAMGQLDNTLVLFLSDNGSSAEIMVRDDGHDREAEPGSAATYLCLGPGWSTVGNTPFRRHKTWTHEGGIATPLIVSWPQGIDARGAFRRQPGHVIDVVPTILELAGADPAKVGAGPPVPLPGKSLVAALGSDAPLAREYLWWLHDGHRAVQVDGWKAVAPKGAAWELYDLAKDRAESNDLASEMPAKRKELAALWERKMADFKEVALMDPPPTRPAGGRKPGGKPKPGQALINAENFELLGKRAFVMHPRQAVEPKQPRPWIFYAPTLGGYPDGHESWMHQQLLDAGVAVAGIDVGEAYGSPLAMKYFDALYSELVDRRGFAQKAVLLGRSRGGLWVSSYAIARPERVAAIAGIYPVFDYTTYPGVERAAAAYGVESESLRERADELNPIRRVEALANAKIPVFIIHGADDKIVPLAQNSAELANRYREAGAGDLVELSVVEGQGHNFWPGFFRCQELVEFAIRHAQAGAE